LQNGRAGNPSTPRAREFQAALHIRSSPVRNPLTLSDTTKSHLIFLTKEDDLRFCVANHMDGFLHCGVAANAATTTGLLKFAVQDNAFYINGGANRDHPMARKDPFIHVDDLPPELRKPFEKKKMTSAQWTSLFVNTLDNANANALEDDIKIRFSTNRSLLSHMLDDNGVVLEEQDYEWLPRRDSNPHEPKPRVEFEWTGMMEEALIGEPSPSHRATLELLRECHNASTGQIQA
jgi:hypothetical protein